MTLAQGSILIVYRTMARPTASLLTTSSSPSTSSTFASGKLSIRRKYLCHTDLHDFGAARPWHLLPSAQAEWPIPSRQVRLAKITQRPQVSQASLGVWLATASPFDSFNQLPSKTLRATGQSSFQFLKFWLQREVQAGHASSGATQRQRSTMTTATATPAADWLSSRPSSQAPRTRTIT